MKIMRCMLVFLLILSLSGSCFAKEYFVAPDGDDANDGSITSPFRDIEKAFSNLSAGDTLTLLSGTHIVARTIRLNFQGTQEAPVILQGRPGAKIQGVFDKRTNRKQFEPDVYCTVNMKGKWGIVRNIEFERMGGSGISGQVINFVFENLYIHDYSNYGMLFSDGAANVRIANCVISGSAIEHGVYLTKNCRDIVFSGCSFSDTAINGIHMNGKNVRDVVIEKCFFYGNSRDWGACVTMINGATNVVVRNNVFYNNLGHHFTFGEGRAVVEHNTLYNDGDRKGQMFVVVGSMQDWVVRNNVVALNTYPVDIKNKGFVARKPVFDYNAYSRAASDVAFFSGNGLEQHGVFKAGFDFADVDLLPRSPQGLQLESGSDGASGAPLLPSVARDFAGNRRVEGGSYGAFASAAE